jgi:hypothetical protein
MILDWRFVDWRLLIVDYGDSNHQSTIENHQRFKDPRSSKSTIENQAVRQGGCWQSQRSSILSPACLQ